jgi:peptide/nickel transport system substrate-binding protein
MYLFHDALFKPMAQGLYTPSLAESWTASPDAKVYEFKLRRGVKFHNGDPLTAEDVVFSFMRYKGSLAKAIHGKMEKAEAVNPYSVRVRLKESFPEFLEYLLPGATTFGWIAPKKYVEKVGDAGFKKHPIGAGPYKFVEHVPGVKLVGEAFEEYWRKVPHVKRLEFYNIPEPATRLAMVKRGEADIGTLMQGVYYEDLKKSQGLRMLAPLSPVRWVAYLTAQWDPKSPWADPRVRRAASLAIDRQTLADVHMPGCGGVSNIALEGDPWPSISRHTPTTRTRPRSCWPKPAIPRDFRQANSTHTRAGIGPTESRSPLTGKQLGSAWRPSSWISQPCWPCGRGER